MKRLSGLGISAATLALVSMAAPSQAQPISPGNANACIQRTAEEFVVATRDIEVTGAGPIDAESGARTLFMRNRRTGQTAECRITTFDNYVTSVRITSGQPGNPNPPVSTANANACIQRTAEEFVIATRDVEITGSGPIDGAGNRIIFMRNRINGGQAECQINVASSRVLSVRITSQPDRPVPPPGRPPGNTVSPNQPSVRACHREIDRQIRRAYARVEKVLFSADTTRTFFISNAKEGVRGDGEFRQGPTWFPFGYSCQVNIRSGRVTQANFTIRR
ncbi:MAG: hypothetical protein OHK0047_27270 [Leptolyngbyaceae cyanobacterium]